MFLRNNLIYRVALTLRTFPCKFLATKRARLPDKGFKIFLVMYKNVDICEFLKLNSCSFLSIEIVTKTFSSTNIISLQSFIIHV